MADEKKYPDPEDDNNRFAWGPGQVQYKDPITGEWKWLGEPDPEAVARANAEREAATKDAADCGCDTKDKAPRAKSRPKVQVHFHRPKR